MGQSLRILFAVAEASPLVKVGGLADVAGSLPQALRSLGHDVALAMPKYGSIKLEARETLPKDAFAVPVQGKEETVSIVQTTLDSQVPVYLLGNKTYFDRASVYGEKDDLDRFLTFSEAIPELPKKLGWKPDIIHCHDWHAAGAIPLLKGKYKDDPFYSSAASVFTIHNLAYQGWFDDSFADRAGLQSFMPPPGDPIRGNCYNMLALAILHSDAVSTVSETYAHEILTPEYGERLETVLQRQKDALFGIVNGIDYDVFNPADDPLIPVKYSAASLDNKYQNKTALQKRAELTENQDVPLLGMIGRLTTQKGIDILVPALEPMLSETDMQFVLLGSGIGAEGEHYQRTLESIATRYPGRVRMFFTFDLALAQLIYSGCDMFLMPSRYEPCGLGQMISMRYGTIPIVRRTGGLADTVHDCTTNLSQGTGFVFERYDAQELLAAVKRAAAAFTKKQAWRKLMVRAMQEDFSWKASAKKYESLYEKALQRRKQR